MLKRILLLLLYYGTLGTGWGWDNQAASLVRPLPQGEETDLPPNHTEVVINGSPATLYYHRLETIAPKVLEAKGQVHLKYEDMLLWADRALFHEESGRIEVEGNVRLVQGIQLIRCQRGEYNLKTKLGSFWEVNGRTDEEFIFQAKRIDKTDQQTFHMDHGFVTACQDAVPKWSFSASHATLTISRSITTKNTLFKVKGIPVFYFPWVRLPAEKKKRSSGFILPSTGSSNAKGRSLAGSFYLTLGRSADLILNTEYFSKRGSGYGFSFRTKPNSYSHVNVSYFYVNDRLHQGGGNFIADAEINFGQGFRGVAALNLVTNFAYRQNFSDVFATATNPIDYSVAFLTYNRSSFGLHWQLARQETFSPGRSILIRSMPGFGFHVLGKKLGPLPLFFYMDAVAESLMREDQYQQTPNFLQRYDLYPKISMPLKKWTGLSLTPRLGVRQTIYGGSLQNPTDATFTGKNVYRSSVEMGFDFQAPALERSFSKKNGSLWKHWLEPSIRYQKITGIGNLWEVPRFDEKDFYTDSHEIEYGITQRLFARSGADKNTPWRELVSWRLFQQYYFDPSFGGAVSLDNLMVPIPYLRLTAFSILDADRLPRFSPIVSSVRFYPRDGWNADFRLDFDPRTQGIRSGGVTGSSTLGPLQSSWTLYASRRYQPGTQLTSEYLSSQEVNFLTEKSFQLQSLLGYGNPTKGFSVSFNWSYDLQRSELMNSHSRLFYNWDCCGLALEYMQFNTGFRNESQIRFAFSLKGLGYFGTIRRPERLF